MPNVMTATKNSKTKITKSPKMKSELCVGFGREIRRRREARDLTLHQLSALCGLTPNFIGTIETGKRDPSVSTVLAVALGLGVPPSELFGSSPDRTAAADEAARLFDRAPPAVQRAVISILRTMAKRRRA